MCGSTVQLHDERIWKRHVDHIVATTENQLEKPPLGEHQDLQIIHDADW